MAGDVTIPAYKAKAFAAAFRHAAMVAVDGEFARQLSDLADLLDPPPADISVTDAEHLSRAEARLDTISPVIVIDPAMGVNITEQIKTLFQVVGKSPSHGAAVVACECLVCAAVHSIADTILRESAPPPPSLRDEVVKAMQNILGYADEHGLTPMAAEGATDGLLAVVRRHVEVLRGWDGGAASMEWSSDGNWIDRDDVLRLLGGES